MKTTSLNKKFHHTLGILGIATVLVVATSSSLSAAPLTYSGTALTNWFAASAWDGPATWTSGDSATFSNNASTTAGFGAITSVAGLTKNGSGNLNISTTGTQRAMTFSGGSIGGNITIANFVNLQGNYTYTGGSGLLHSGSNKTAYSGTATINSGPVTYTNISQLGSASDFTVAGGELILEMSATATMGDIAVNNGNFTIGRSGTNDATNATITSLSGSGGAVRTVATQNAARTRVLTIDQSTDTSFAGAINGVAGSGTTLGQIQMVKTGAGHLTLSGNITLGTSTASLGTQVQGGALFINSATTSFTRSTGGSLALGVENGAILGGTGTITVNDGRFVGINGTTGGRLAAGSLNTAGRTTYTFNGGGGLSLSGGVTKGDNDWLLFDLGSDLTAGTTYDQIRLTLGFLNLGADLEFTDFSFNALAGFNNGTYTLFETPSALTGTLGANLSGLISGRNSTLSISGNNLILTVVPEPSTAMLLALGLGLTVVIRRNRSRNA